MRCWYRRGPHLGCEVQRGPQHRGAAFKGQPVPGVLQQHRRLAAVHQPCQVSATVTCVYSQNATVTCVYSQNATVTCVFTV